MEKKEAYDVLNIFTHLIRITESNNNNTELNIK